MDIGDRVVVLASERHGRIVAHGYTAGLMWCTVRLDDDGGETCCTFLADQLRPEMVVQLAFDFQE